MDTHGSTEARGSSSPVPYVDFGSGGDQVAFASQVGLQGSSSEEPGASPTYAGGAEGALEHSVHHRLSLDSESDTSSVDERLSVSSIASSIEDQLT